jgi:hypothetical protein
MPNLRAVCTNLLEVARSSLRARKALLPSILVTAALLAAPACLAAAPKVPLPRSKPASLLQPPAAEPEQPELTEPEEESGPAAVKDPGPSACQLRLGNIAAIQPVAAIVGPGECGGEDLVRLDAVKLKDKSTVAISPPANLRCSMAEALAIWVREDIAPAAAELGGPMRSLDNFASYHCRGRNNIIGAKMSEHGRGNAIDVRGVILAKKKVELTDVNVSRQFRDRIRASACARFMTVLGPGSDGYHEGHVHVDLAERRNNHRMCQWELRDPAAEKPAEEAPEEVAAIPLPRPRPAEIQNRRRL